MIPISPEDFKGLIEDFLSKWIYRYENGCQGDYYDSENFTDYFYDYFYEFLDKEFDISTAKECEKIAYEIFLNENYIDVSDYFDILWDKYVNNKL